MTRRQGVDAGGAPGQTPLVTLGLPVYNGEEYLRESLDGLLAQTFKDFELVISDNASTDATPEIIREYAASDPRIRYIRQAVNQGAVPNHNLLVREARGKYFKWAAHDDLYEPLLLERCVAALESHPEAVLANVWDGTAGPDGRVIEEPPYPLASADPRPHVRLRSLLYEDGGNDFYGLMRTDVLRATAPHDSYPHADRTFMAGLILAGPWYEVPEVLYHRREHPDRVTHAGSSRQWSVSLDPRRANRWRYPWLRLYGEYVLGFVRAVLRSQLVLPEKIRCLMEVMGWFVSRLRPSRMRAILEADGIIAPRGREPSGR